jgi:hypothetical protein
MVQRVRFLSPPAIPASLYKWQKRKSVLEPHDLNTYNPSAHLGFPMSNRIWAFLQGSTGSVPYIVLGDSYSPNTSPSLAMGPVPPHKQFNSYRISPQSPHTGRVRGIKPPLTITGRLGHEEFVSGVRYKTWRRQVLAPRLWIYGASTYVGRPLMRWLADGREFSRGRLTLATDTTKPAVLTPTDLLVVQNALNITM